MVTAYAVDICAPVDGPGRDRGQTMRRFEVLRRPSNPRSCRVHADNYGVYGPRNV
jgi:hypothetical protein